MTSLDHVKQIGRRTGPRGPVFVWANVVVLGWLAVAVALVAAGWPSPVPQIGWALATISVAVFVLLALRVAVWVALRGRFDVKSERHPGTTTGVVAGLAAVVIDPPDLPAVDREYILVSAQLFLGDPGGDAQVAKIRAGQPDGWMFNGTVAQYDHAPLTARTGERVRIWVVNAGPGDLTAFHVVGAQFESVYKEGGWLLRRAKGGAQVLDLAPAQGGFVELSFPEPGHYPFVDHDMRHAESGAHGTISVVGQP